MTHADAVREAKDRVVECACIETHAENAMPGPEGGPISQATVVWDCTQHRRLAVDEYEALVAQTCDQCGGAGVIGRWNSHPMMADKCPAACDNGKRKEPANG